MGSTSLKGWIEAMVTVVVTVLLSLVSLQLSGYLIVLAVLPLVFFALRRGLIQGLLASILVGITILVMNLGEADVMSGLVTYFGPYGFIGLSGLFARNTQRTLNNKRFPNAALNIVTASIFGSFLFFIWLLVESGELTSELIGWTITAAIVSIILVIVAKVAPKAFIPRDTPFLSRKEKSRLLND